MRRRRRLRDGGAGARHAAEASAAVQAGDSTDAECAALCLDTQGCMAYDNANGHCKISSRCDGAKRDFKAFTMGNWHVWASLSKSDLTSAEPAAETVKKVTKKRRRRKKAKGAATDAA